MPCTEAYKEHIEYTFNAFCRVVIHYAAINAWRDRDKRRISHRRKVLSILYVRHIFHRPLQVILSILVYTFFSRMFDLCCLL